jgi:Fe/S biogenesis protein NfuA
MIEVTQEAEDFLNNLIITQDAGHMAIRVEVNNGGTPSAQITMSFLEIADADESYVQLVTESPLLKVYTLGANDRYLEGGRMDFRENDTGGTIVVDAPNLHLPNISADSPLDDRINYVLYSEVNPSLASHGGMVSLIEVAEDNIAVLQFGGGCQGCGMVDMTLKQGVETTLIERVPELTAVRDVTDHTNRENAYYT